MSRALRLLAAALPLALGADAGAQSSLLQLDGASHGDQSGSAVDGAGDVNADGTPDVIVGAWSSYVGGWNTGRVRVHSGVDGTLLHEWLGGQVGERLGYAVCGLGDVDGDGHDDVAVSAPLHEVSGQVLGRVLVLSGADGARLLAIDGIGGGFGVSLRPAGDVDGDGCPDLIVGADQAEKARVHSGCDGALLWEFEGGGAFGRSVDGAGDVDGDGVPDLIVGAPNPWDVQASGQAVVFSGATGQAILDVGGDDWPWVFFGQSVSGAGDVNGDGHADLLVGAPIDEVIAHPGSVRLYSGADGTLLHRFGATSAKDIHFGWAVRGVGDVDGDGLSDVAMATRLSSLGPSFTPGLVQVRSGLDGSLLAAFAGDDPADQLGRALGIAGDVDGDGTTDLVLGAPGASVGGPWNGYARVVSLAGMR